MSGGLGKASEKRWLWVEFWIRWGLQSKWRKWCIQRQGEPRELCLIKVCLVWHDWVVKGAVEMVRMKQEEVARSWKTLRRTYEEAEAWVQEGVGAGNPTFRHRCRRWYLWNACCVPGPELGGGDTGLCVEALMPSWSWLNVQWLDQPGPQETHMVVDRMNKKNNILTCGDFTDWGRNKNLTKNGTDCWIQSWWVWLHEHIWVLWNKSYGDPVEPRRAIPRKGPVSILWPQFPYS